ncbi:MAG: winged helix-turn-helix domain-containing protein [Terriglobales bacterium]
MEKTYPHFRFGPFTVDSEAREVSKNGNRLRLPGQPYLILETLLTRAGKVVTRDEIRATLWEEDTFVDFEHGLNTSVKKLRQALDDSVDNPRYIETVRGMGYRFIAPVEIVVATKEPFEPAPYAPPPNGNGHAKIAEPLSAPRFETETAVALPQVRVSHRWKTATFAAIVLVFALAVGAGLLYRAHQRGKRLKATDNVVLADFSNSTGDAAFDDTLKTALNISLGQSPFLNVLPGRDVAKTLREMTLPANAKLTPAQSAELCLRLHSRAYILGAIGSLGTDYVIGLKAIDCQTGDTLGQQQITVYSKGQVLDALGQSASRLRTALGESLATVQKFSVPLAEATTPSFEALKEYTLGLNAYNEKGPPAALPHHLRAIQLDPNFAMAYRQLGSDYYSLLELERAREYDTRAFQLRDRVSEREKLSIEGDYYAVVTGELDKSIEVLRKRIETYPRFAGAHTNMGLAYAGEGQYEKAAEVTKEGMLRSPERSDAYVDLATDFLALQSFDQTRALIRLAHARGMEDEGFHSNLYILAFFGGDAQGMAEQRKWFADKPDFEHQMLELDSDSAAYGGHLRQARELTKRAVDSAIKADNRESAAIWQAIAAQREAAFGNAAEARKLAVEALKIAPSSQGVKSESALAFAMAKDQARAEFIAEDLGKRFPLDTQMQSLWLPAIRAQSALYRKDPAAALKTLQAATPFDFGQIQYLLTLSCLYPIYLRGEAYLAAGEGSAAAAEFQKMIDHNGIVWNCWTGALAPLGVARANALQAKASQGVDADAGRVRAREAYKKFLTQWKDADPDIPILKEAKAEYARLE